MDRIQYLQQFVDETDSFNDIVLGGLLHGSIWRPLPHLLQSWLRNYIGGTLVYLVSGFLWCFYIYYLKRNAYIPKDAIPSYRAMKLQIIVAMKAMPWYSTLPTLSEYMVENGWTKCISRISEVGWPMYIVYLTTYLVLCEFGIYWMHRELHDIKPLYKHLHATHHIYNKQNTLSPFADFLSTEIASATGGVPSPVIGAVFNYNDLGIKSRPGPLYAGFHVVSYFSSVLKSRYLQIFSFLEDDSATGVGLRDLGINLSKIKC